MFKESVKRLPKFCRDIKKYKAMSDSSSAPIDRYYPILTDMSVNNISTKIARTDYFQQDLWAARKIRKRNPKRHIDIGSRIDGFITHLLAFREVIMVDIRPLDSNIDGLNFVQGDATEMAFFKDESLNSISSLHAAEHFGLGRYDDPIDPQGHTKFMSHLQRVLKRDGRLYFSVPVGRERVEFNIDRILSPYTVLDKFDGLELVSLDGVLSGELVKSVSPEELDNEERACGLFEFTK